MDNLDARVAELAAKYRPIAVRILKEAATRAAGSRTTRGRASST